MICPVCNMAETFCPVCQAMYAHGTRSTCSTHTKVRLFCVGCKLLVQEDVEGILTEEGRLMVYVGMNEFVCSLCLEHGKIGREAVHSKGDRQWHPTRKIFCCRGCAELKGGVNAGGG